MAAFTSGQLAALEKAIATGVTEFTHDGVTTKYRSLSEMIALRNLMAADLGVAVNTTPNNSPVFMTHGKGYR